MMGLLSRIVAVAVALPSVGAEIAVPDAATRVERTAAAELSSALGRITGGTFEVVSESKAGDAAYFVGATALAKRLAATNGWTACAPDEIRRGTVDGKVVLDGDAARGVLYSVDSFLEDIAGVRWWTSGEGDYPRRPGWTPGALAPYRYAPPFRFRETFYRATLMDADFKVRAKVNTTSYTRFILPPNEEKFIPPEQGGNHKLVFFKGRRSAYHSFFQILPPAKHFKNHPEWYSLVNGVRTANGYDTGTGQRPAGQLCLTNDEMFRAYVAETKRLLRENPDCDSIQVTQNDWNKDWCECEKCKAFYDREGAVSGLYIDFANRVAAEVEKDFPNVTIDTFAYMFTRKAPKSVRPRHNVVVRLCDIECAFNRPLADPTCEQNRTFLADLRAWSKVAAGNLYIWDYQANFTSYMMPHPNLQVFSDNLRLFRDAGAVGVFEQGDAMCAGGDFAALKCYVTSHLMWDPSKDWRALTDEFLNGYYGTAAAPHLKEVLRLASDSATCPDAPAMGCYHGDAFPWITPEAGRKALVEMEAALASAKSQSNVFARRVRLAKLSWDHARIRSWRRWGQEGSPAEAIAAFKAAIREFGIDAYHETTTRKTLADYLNGEIDRAAERHPTMSERQQKLTALVDKHAKAVLEAERWLWAHPQTGFTEWQAHGYLTNRFAALGYRLTCAGNIPGFYADLDTGRPGPKVCVLAELDALDIPGHPEAVNGMSHLCGHHGQCAALLGLASALKEPGALDGLSGSIRLMFVPSEELVQVSFRDRLREEGTIRYFGGKPEFMRRGHFDGVDMAMNVHQGGPARADGVVFDAIGGCNGCLTKKVVFKGKTAHAGANPNMGVNAQYAAMLALQACNDLRETFVDSESIRWHPVMRDGGGAVNNIPETALVESYVRGKTMEAIKRENAKLNRAIAGAALAMGARVELHDRPGYAPGAFDANFLRVMERACADMVGREKVLFNPSGWGGGSTDMSDLACVMPCAWFNVNGGFTGCGHRVDYRITDPYRLCVDSAKAQILVVDALLRDSAAAARDVIAKFKPPYPSIAAYLKTVDEVFLDREAVVYDKDGHGSVRYW